MNICVSVDVGVSVAVFLVGIKANVAIGVGVRFSKGKAVEALFLEYSKINVISMIMPKKMTNMRERNFDPIVVLPSQK
ncbi:MAG: hypothetical protein A2Z49_05580 [Chloroflexi bacterium RBG_19FT_COMBO_56_12]|nr:MAG: hypothetical protein A2W36_01145 [Chloroflexi bacterium RBG_16_58_14]OGO72461.1 MAG: hypothetical protein A2Z49_05580 [Chloroflexi bacterium RBG_19FT_COMBO_56_12]